MKKILFITFLLIVSNVGFGQSKSKSIKQIRSHFKWVNSQKDFEIVELNNEDFMDFPTDNGATLKGYFKHDTLYKIVRIIGISYAILNTEYYLKDNKLIFVYDTESPFKEATDSLGNITGFDYTQTKLTFQGRYYYSHEKKIKTLEKGERLLKLDTAADFVAKAHNYESMLRNKKDFKKEYDLLQGKWVSTEDSLVSFEFDGLIELDYYDGEFLQEYRIKIEGNYFYSTDLIENASYKYEILNLTEKRLTLMFLPSGRILKYKKID